MIVWPGPTGPSGLPTGAGQYVVSAWAMQNDNPTQTVALQVNLSCGTTATSHFPTIGTFGLSLTQGVWAQITGTLDLTAFPDCQPGAVFGLVGRGEYPHVQIGPRARSSDGQERGAGRGAEENQEQGHRSERKIADE